MDVDLFNVEQIEMVKAQPLCSTNGASAAL